MNTNTNSAIFNDPRAKRWGNFAKYAAILGVGFVVAPYVWIAIGGLLGLGAVGALFGATWMLRPWVYAKAANIRLALVKSEARKNPVETLENDLRDKNVALDERKTQIEKLNAQIRNFADKLDDIGDKYGKQDSGYLKLAGDLSDLRRVYKHRCEKWNEARKQLVRYSEEIDRAKMIWDAANAAAAARETSGLTEDEFFAKLKTDTAFDSIQTSYNEALASLDTELLTDPAESVSSSNQNVDVSQLNNAKDVKKTLGETN
jgi:chromosome segregation ATPase